jgi:uncharacterized protein
MAYTFEIGPGLTCDLQRLLATRLLLTANSGKGKSWCLRRILEQTHGHVQQLIMDPEGEFASLRAKYDYVHVAKAGADLVADPVTAGRLALRLLELRVSAVLDIYELAADARVAFVGAFLHSLVDAPRELWRPLLVVLDEAHVYAPQSGAVASARAVKDLATRGRKRGFCLVLATQRLSKLHKDVAAEANNKLIGRTSLDVDLARAADELGMRKAGALVLRDLVPGDFLAHGPALSGEARVRVGSVETAHPNAIMEQPALPPHTDSLRALLPQLAVFSADAPVGSASTVGPVDVSYPAGHVLPVGDGTRSIEAGRRYSIFYRHASVPDGGDLIATWTGKVDRWGRLELDVLDASPPTHEEFYYLFPHELVDADSF